MPRVSHLYLNLLKPSTTHALNRALSNQSINQSRRRHIYIKTFSNLLYSKSLKSLKLTLGVRESTPGNVCLAELGYPGLKPKAQERQYTFFRKHIEKTPPPYQDPLLFAITLCREKRTKSYQFIERITATQENLIVKDLNQRRTTLMQSERSKDKAYVSINPDVKVDPVYLQTSSVSEHVRLNFTRLRCISHNLAIERGRYTRTPREERTCPCGEIQTECHVMFACPLTAVVRTKYSVLGTTETITPALELSKMECRYYFISEVIQTF